MNVLMSPEAPHSDRLRVAASRMSAGLRHPAADRQREKDTKR